ncbi:MAG: hypothetical protein DMG71_07320 [Acidobacteria bacterium]|nr:MAG: hypothetical protein DMG71_07320 [Acidobacteriota bacterium]
MAAGKKPKDRRRWSLPPESDPKQKEFVQPFSRRESDAVKSQVQGWLKLAERALTDKDDEDKTRVA